MKRSLKVLALLISCLVMASSFYGCGNNVNTADTESTQPGNNDKKEAPNNNESSEDIAKEPVTIKFIHWRNEDADTYRKIIQMFEQKNPSIHVDMEVTPADIGQYYTLLKSRLMSEGNVDLFFVHPEYITELSQAGYCYDLTKEPFLKNYKETLVPVGEVDGKIYGVTQALNVFTVFYNKKIFDNLGLNKPKTFDELSQICETLKDNNVGTIATGFAESWTADIVFLTLLAAYSNNDQLIYKKLETGELKYSDEPYVTVFKVLQEMGKKGMFQKNAVGTKYDASLALFAQEKCAMLNTGTWSIGGLKKQNPDLDFGVFVLPAPNGKIVAPMVPAQLLSINSKSEYKNEAIKFAEFLSAPKIASIYANETGQLSSVKNASADMPEMKEVAKLLEGESMINVGMYITKPKIMQISDEAAIRAVIGENIDEIILDAQKQLEEVINN